jgi:flagellar biosynthesis protein
MKTKAAALRYDKLKNKAPKLVAKGEGKIAAHIIELAKEHNIPIQKDEDLVEMLSQVELDKEIPPQMYKAVAEVFSFIYKTTKQN